MSSSSEDSDVEVSKQPVKSTRASSSDSNGSSNKRESRPKKRQIDSGDSDSDGGKSKKKTVLKKSATKRKRDSSDVSDIVDDSLFVDAEDKARWKSLTELEKEKEIYDRIEARDMRKAREEIAQQLEAKKEKEAKKSKKDKRKKVASSDESERSASPPPAKKPVSDSDSDADAEYHRPSEVNRKKNQKNAMAELKQKRKELEKKNAKNTLSIDAVFGSQSSGSSSSSSSAASSRSSSVSSRGSSPARSEDGSQAVKKEVETLAELKRARLSRFKLLKYVHESFFKDMVCGCFIKVGIGHESGSESKYKLWQIEDVVEGKVYQVEEKRTNKHLKAKFGRREKVFKIAFVSNAEFTQTEFDEWLVVTKAEGNMTYVDFIETKEKDIEKAVYHSFTDEEINKKLEEKRKFQKVPRNFAVLKSELQKKKKVAQQAGDIPTVHSLQKKIDEIDREANQLDRVRSSDLSAIAWINQRNRNKNKNEILSGNVEIDIASQDDPFTRKKGVMKVVAGVKKTEAQIKAEKEAEQNKKVEVAKTEAAADAPSSSKVTTAPAARRKPGSTAMFDLHSACTITDFDIDLNKLIGGGSKDDSFDPPTAPRPPVTKQLTSGKSARGLSIEDYRKRRAAMKGST